MEANFRAQQNTLSLSECERLCGRTSLEVREIASHIGWQGLSSHGLSLPVEAALDLLILSDAMSYGAEPRSISMVRIGLRTEALLKLGEDPSSWSFGIQNSADKDFWPLLWGVREVVYPRIARVLGVHADVAKRALRYHSQADVEQLTNLAYETGAYSDRSPRFTIDAHHLASRLKSSFGGSLFNVTCWSNT